jgi:hypothetical protein
MICQDCRNGYHEGCKGDTWCPCQHRGHQCSRECNHDAERPQRKSLVELVTDGHHTTEASLHEAALTELTQLTQEMGLE